MRVVSFLPSATETLYKLGAGSMVVGVTHECKYPSQARRKPHVIRSSFDAAKMRGSEIDKVVVELLQTGKDIYVIDDKALKRSRPDLIVAQGLCEVCSPFTKEINRAVSILGEKTEVLVLDPHDLDDILVSIMDVAEKVGKVQEGRKVVASLQARIDRVRGIKIKSKPKVLCVEWIDPLVWARAVQPGEKGYKLGDVAARLNVALEKAHRATDDAEAAGHVLIALMGDGVMPYREVVQKQREYAAAFEKARGHWRR